MVAEKIKLLREKKGITQAELAKKIGITRSCVNAWEMGISAPSTQFIVELALFFGVSTDYLLDIPGQKTVSVEGLSEREIATVVDVIERMREKR